MAITPDEWLPILAKRLDLAYPRIATLRRYSNGNAPLPEMGENVKASWQAFQKKARTNYGGLALASLAMRVKPNGIRVGESGENEAVLVALRQWRDNRLDVQFADAIFDYLDVGIGYMAVGAGVGAGVGAVITREMPENFIAATDPLRPWKARAALKVWRDVDLRRDFAYVWAIGEGQLYYRDSRPTSGVLLTRASGSWIKTGPPDVYEGEPSVVILERKGGEGFIEPHLDVIDRINAGKLQRLTTTAMQAFRQRGIKGDLPEKDSDGNDIDWKAVFEPAPGALWDLPPGVDIWESQDSSTAITAMLLGEKADARDFAAVTHTPISALIPDGENQTTQGAENAKEGQIFQAKEEISRLGSGLAVVMVHALRAENVEIGDATVQILWQPPDHVSLSERFAAAALAKASGMSRKTILRDIIGMTPDQIKQDEADLADEQLNAVALIQPVPSGNPVA